MDLGKAVALAVSHQGELSEYTAGLKGAKKIGKVAPIIAIPTTSGTGSEISTERVIIMRNGEKLILASRELIPIIAICDPLLTVSLPARLTAATGKRGRNATHCIEALLSNQNKSPPQKR